MRKKEGEGRERYFGSGSPSFCPCWRHMCPRCRVPIQTQAHPHATPSVSDHLHTLQGPWKEQPHPHFFWFPLEICSPNFLMGSNWNMVGGARACTSNKAFQLCIFMFHVEDISFPLMPLYNFDCWIWVFGEKVENLTRRRKSNMFTFILNICCQLWIYLRKTCPYIFPYPPPLRYRQLAEWMAEW